MSLPHLRDLSNWQARIDWQLEREQVAAVYVKVSQGLTFVDPTAKAKIAGARSVKLPVGGYHYCTPGVGSPEVQADILLAHAPFRPGGLRPCLDCEANPLRLNSAQLAAWYLGAVLRVRKRTGLWPVIYGPPSYLAAFATYHPGLFGLCPLWVADWGVRAPTVPAPWSHWDAWQWTDAYRDPAAGRVDDSFAAGLAALKIPVSAGSVWATWRTRI